MCFSLPARCRGACSPLARPPCWPHGFGHIRDPNIRESEKNGTYCACNRIFLVGKSISSLQIPFMLARTACSKGHCNSPLITKSGSCGFVALSFIVFANQLRETKHQGNCRIGGQQTDTRAAAGVGERAVTAGESAWIPSFSAKYRWSIGCITNR